MILQSVHQLPLSFTRKFFFRIALVRLYIAYTIESFAVKIDKHAVTFTQIVFYFCAVSLLRSKYHIRRQHWKDYSPQKRYIIVSNHIDRLDPFFIFSSLSFSDYRRIVPLKIFTANQYLQHIFSLLRFLGAFPAYSIPQKRSGLREGLRILDSQINLLIFPEGKRNQSGKQVNLKIGAAYLGERRDVTFIPVYIERDEKTVSVTWGASFTLDRATGQSLEEYNKSIFDRVLKLATQ